ncbi:MAG: metallophosphoesterase family protein [Kofleriaceae bacterium]
MSTDREYQGPTAPPAVGHTAALVDLLLTVGYIDGVFHAREQAFVERYLESVLVLVEASDRSGPAGGQALREATAAQFAALYAQLNELIARLRVEVMTSGDESYVPTRLKVRAVTLFRGFTPAEQTTALELVRALMHADGVITAPEQLLYEELLGYFTTAPRPADALAPTLVGAPAVSVGQPAAAPTFEVTPIVARPLQALAHPLLDPLEQTFSPHPGELSGQIALDYQLVSHAMTTWHRLRAHGHGRLAGVTDVGQIPSGAQFLDGCVHVLRPARPTEVIVLGDLHGCYSCLKGALLQTNFVNRVWAHQWDPANHGDVKLVFLGDYIDRGRFSFDGVLRAVLQLQVAMPDNVVVLRGNHEYFHSRDGHVWSGVHPAEALASLSPHVPREMLEAYRILFDHMPTSCLLDRTLLVHGGIPRDDTLAERYRDLGSLNDGELRFQMMWSDPEQVDHIPVELQRQNARFSFGRDQFRAFMERVGVTTMIRGHEKIDRGFEVVYDLGAHRLLNLFSAGGRHNRDLPVDASYRSVTPMALTIHCDGGRQRAVPWPIQYEAFNSEVHNGFHRPAPLLEFRYV